MEFSGAAIKELFFKQYNSLSEEDIVDINSKSQSGDINNVVAGLNDHCFGVWLIDEFPDVNYQLFYINGKS